MPQPNVKIYLMIFQRFYYILSDSIFPYMAEDKRIWRVVPDTSVIIDGRLSSRIKSGDFRGAEVIIPEAVVSELEAQANRGREIGFKGLEELLELRKLADRNEILLQFSGVQPTLEEIKLSKEG